MFCANCGAQISASQRFCTSCGAKNDNYVEEKKPKIKISMAPEKQKVESLHKADSGERSIKLSKRWGIISIVVVIIFIILIAVIGGSFLINQKCPIFPVANAYVKKGAYGYVSSDGSTAFLIDDKIFSFSGDIKTAITTPDYSKYIILNNSGELLFYTNPSSDSKKIAENVNRISAVNNQGVFIWDESNQRLKFYFFDGKEYFDIGFDKDYTIRYSENNMTVAGVDSKGELYIYTVGSENLIDLCKVGEDADICAVANSGDNVIWSGEKGHNIYVYMMQNGVPERIGKLSKPEGFYSVESYFFDNGKSFIVYAAKTSKLLLSINGEYPKEIELKGIMDNEAVLDQDGHNIYSEASRMESFYFALIKGKDGKRKSLYCMDLNGTLTEVVSDIDVSINWDFWDYWSFQDSKKFYLVKGNVFYLDEDGDFFVKAVNEDDVERITTEVDAIYVPSGGKYVYLVKSGTLYFWDSSDDEHKLNVITTKFETNNSLYLTDADDIIYYITDTTDITYTEEAETKDTFVDKGTLKKYTIGGESIQISDNIIGVWTNDAEWISSEYPIIRKYIDVEGLVITEEIGTIIDGSYSVVLKNT